MASVALLNGDETANAGRPAGWSNHQAKIAPMMMKGQTCWFGDNCEGVGEHRVEADTPPVLMPLEANASPSFGEAGVGDVEPVAASRGAEDGGVVGRGPGCHEIGGEPIRSLDAAPLVESSSNGGSEMQRGKGRKVSEGGAGASRRSQAWDRVWKL